MIQETIFCRSIGQICRSLSSKADAAALKLRGFGEHHKIKAQPFTCRPVAQLV